MYWSIGLGLTRPRVQIDAVRMTQLGVYKTSSDSEHRAVAAPSANILPQGKRDVMFLRITLESGVDAPFFNRRPRRPVQLLSCSRLCNQPTS